MNTKEMNIKELEPVSGGDFFICKPIPCPQPIGPINPIIPVPQPVEPIDPIIPVPQPVVNPFPFPFPRYDNF